MEKNISEIREHIRAVRETRQITNAMYLLSAARMKKALPQVEYTREYVHRLRAAVKDIMTHSPGLEHEYLAGQRSNEQSVQRPAFLILAADKGMAGAFNHSVLQFAYEQIPWEKNPYIATVGIYATEFFVRKGVKPDREFLGMAQNPSIGNARALKDELFALYDAGEISELSIIHMRFISSTTQYPRKVRLLPVSLDDLQHIKLELEYDREMIYHPSAKEVFYLLIPQYAVSMFYGTLAQSYASEHCARMNAMQSATKNADELIEKLSHAYHSARQLRITQELTETVSAGFLQEAARETARSFV